MVKNPYLDLETEDPENDTAPSRTQRKKADRELRVMGEALTGLSRDQLMRMDLPEALLSAIQFYQEMRSLVARRRQWKTIGALLRDVDRSPIQAALENLQRGDRVKVLRHRRIERWRDELAAGNSAPVAEILAACPAVDRQRLNQLARSAMKEAAAASGVTAARALFRYLDGIAGDID